MRQTVLFIFFFLFALQAQQYTRGVGVYPGDPRQDFAPALVPDTQTVRNLALQRAAYQSSSYDFYHTAQLVTDSICAAWKRRQPRLARPVERAAPAARVVARSATTSKPFAPSPRSRWKPPARRSGKAAAG